MASRSDRTTGEYRDPRHGGPAGTLPRTRPQRREWLRENRKKPERGRYSGTPFMRWARVRRAFLRIHKRLNEGRPTGPRPHPTKRGPGRV